ncbi:MAG: hypothetical protein M1827_000649 [Pycnora praestabilis]|nr:MAG: hypothetical protein M1827_000649 [Pycnora praestabilis]
MVNTRNFALLRPCASLFTKPQSRCAEIPSWVAIAKPAVIASQHQKRKFVSSSSFNPEPQTLTASRSISQPADALYAVIADVESYSSFLPFCSSSKITEWSSKHNESGKPWPQEATLEVGYGGYSEKFTSKIFCVPGSVLEAVAGTARTSIQKQELEHHNKSSMSEAAAGNHMFTSLMCRWNLNKFPYKPPPPAQSGGASNSGGEGIEGSHGDPKSGLTTAPAKEQTDVNLVIEYQFASPVYAALSKAVAPKIAGMMIEAFEKRAEEVLSGKVEGVGKGGKGPGLGAVEGNSSLEIGH